MPWRQIRQRTLPIRSLSNIVLSVLLIRKGEIISSHLPSAFILHFEMIQNFLIGPVKPSDKPWKFYLSNSTMVEEILRYFDNKVSFYILIREGIRLL